MHGYRSFSEQLYRCTWLTKALCNDLATKLNVDDLFCLHFGCQKMATTEHVKKFVFASQTSCGSTDEKVEIFIPEVGLLCGV